LASAFREPWSTMTTAVRSQSAGGEELAADADAGIKSERRSLPFVLSRRGGAGIGALLLLLLLLQEVRAP
jgi:hypothetical protein